MGADGVVTSAGGVVGADGVVGSGGEVVGAVVTKNCFC